MFSFKRPSDEEVDHDFLWRTTRCLPERGRIGVFNRSYYEEVLVVRVHPEILAAQRLPDKAADSPLLWKQRFESIVDFERHLHRNGTRVVKFFLHVSKDEQRRRLLARIDHPKKNWKMGAADLAERDRWKDYMRVRGLPRSHQHGPRTLVCSARRRQAQRPSDRVAGHSRHDEPP